MVPGRLDGKRQLLRTGLRQGAGRYPQERLVSGWLAGERELLHSLTGSAEGGAALATPAFSSDCQGDDATRSGESRTGGKATKKRCVDLIEAAWH
jgi:hypothetical protein